MGSFDKSVHDESATLRIVSGQGGQYEVSGELREMLCLTEGGELFISQSHGANPHVLGFMERLSRNNVAFKVKKVSLSEIRALYEKNVSLRVSQAASRSEMMAAAAAAGTASTVRQNEVVAYFKKATSRGASDIHLIVNETDCEVRFRIDGGLLTVDTLTAQHGIDLGATVYGSMCDVAERMYNPAKPQDGRVERSFVKECGLFGARFASRPTDRGTLIVMRLLYATGIPRDLKGLGYLDSQISIINRMIARPKGIKIFSGETGSGKSTVLERVLSKLQEMNNYTQHLLTIEDPPEYRIKGANQTDVGGEKTDEDWADSISNAMRLDPDNIMVGEIRSLISARTAFRAAMTGHGVWTTLHANDVLSSLGRLLDLGVEMQLLSDPGLVTGLMNQSLVRTLCECKRPFAERRSSLPTDLVERVVKTCQVEKVFVRGDGCDECSHTGIRGRKATAEILVPTKTLMRLFKEKGKEEAREYWVKEMLGITKCQHLISHINDGTVDPLVGEEDVCALDEDLITLEM